MKNKPLQSSKFQKFLCLLLVAFIMSSCSRYIAPPFTSVDKIVTIEPGMSMSRVSATLGIDPYDILHLNDDNSIILSYNYRLKDRFLKVNTTNRDEFERQTRNESSQTRGSDWYNKEYKRLFVLFNDGKVKSFITDTGKEDSEFLLITANNIVLASKGEVNSYDLDMHVVPLKESIRSGKGERVGRSEFGILQRINKIFNKED